MLARQLGNKWDVRSMSAQRDAAGPGMILRPADGGERRSTVIGTVTARSGHKDPVAVSR
jgi:hypothetical protein